MLKRQYETVTIVSPDAGTEGLEKVLVRMREALEKTEAQEVRLEDWGVKKLAFPLRHKRSGHYLYLNYLGTNTTVAELERLLGITESALKYQTIRLADRVESDAFDFEAAGSELTRHARTTTLPRAAGPAPVEDEPEHGDEDQAEAPAAAAPTPRTREAS